MLSLTLIKVILGVCLWLPSRLMFHFPSNPKISQTTISHHTYSSLRRLSFDSNRFTLLANKYESEQEWISAQSIDVDGYLAVDEVLARLSNRIESSQNAETKYAMIFFISTLYESTSFNYEHLFQKLKGVLPQVEEVLGCTTGTAIGQLGFNQSPIEPEARAGISALLIPIGNDKSIKSVSSFQWSEEDLTTIINEKQQVFAQSDLSIMISSDSSKLALQNLMHAQPKQDSNNIIGFLASSVTNLQIPKMFRSSKSTGFEKISQGIVGLTLVGDIATHSLISHSCVPVGPVYNVVQLDGTNLLSIENGEMSGDEKIAAPLAHLTTLLDELSIENSFKLKEELLISIVPKDQVTKSGSLCTARDFFVQKPISYDPVAGGIQLPYIPNSKELVVQFCVRDSVAARKDFRRTLTRFRQQVDITGDKSLAFLLLGSQERGNKLFRYSNWESLWFYQYLKEANHLVPITGLYTNGVLGRWNDNVDGLMEMNGMYTLICKKSSNQQSTIASDNLDIEESVMTDFETRVFNDIHEKALVSKRDTDSAHPVRVATMDFYVPEKAPQPSNLLESFVWEREKEVDRFRERFQLARALMQVKAAMKTIPIRNIFEQIVKKKEMGDKIPVIASIARDSFYNGFLCKNGMDIDIKLLGTAMSQIKSLAGIEVNVDSGVYRGKSEDIIALRSLPETSSFPIICNDFVVYAYQIFQAKSAGADCIKLMASVLPLQELTYLMKITKTFDMSALVVVSSIEQFIEVMTNIKDLPGICVTSRNQKLWKIQPGKAHDILRDEHVNDLIKKKRIENPNFVIFHEGFTSAKDIQRVNTMNVVDCIILGEELFQGREVEGTEDDFVTRINEWTGSM